MTDTTSIPLNKLVPWNGNVRKTAGDKNAIAELAASISAHGLINNLVVRPDKDGTFAVVTGGRRLVALQTLAKEGTLKVDHPVRCRVLDNKDSASELSLAENFAREDMHPADEFEAFKALADAGQTATEIAKRFGLAEKDVLQRLKLARVSPVIVKAYRDGKTELECVMAFAVTDDHKRQEHFWKSAQTWQKEQPRAIRQAMTEGEISAADKRLRFVTLKAYEQAGGTTRRDLFTDGENGIFVTKPDLLNDLVTAKIEKKKQSLLKAGWKWVEVLPENDHETVHRHKELEPAGPKEAFSRKQMANAGVFLRIDYDGSMAVRHGYVKREDAKAAKAAAPAKKPAKDKSVPRPGLSQALVNDLIAERTTAVSALLATQPVHALRATVYAVGMQVLYGSPHEGPVAVSIGHSNRPVGFAERCKPRGLQDLDNRRKALKEGLPAKAKFWKYCVDADQKTLLSILALCAAYACRNDNDELAQLLGLDMTAWFTPTAANYFSRISKDDMLKAIREATGKPPAPAAERMKKSELIAVAERTVKGTGWLPQLLRNGKPVEPATPKKN